MDLDREAGYRVVGINQFTFGFGPSLVGVIRDRVGTYAAALGLCMALQATAAVLIMLRPGRTQPRRDSLPGTVLSPHCPCSRRSSGSPPVVSKSPSNEPVTLP